MVREQQWDDMLAWILWLWLLLWWWWWWSDRVVVVWLRGEILSCCGGGGGEDGDGHCWEHGVDKEVVVEGGGNEGVVL